MKTVSIPELLVQRENQIENEVKKQCDKVKELAKKEMNLFKFELLLASIIDEKELEAITKQVRKDRERVGEEAMKRAGGDIEKAMLIYDEVAAELS
jgi:hypothetical protein